MTFQSRFKSSLTAVSYTHLDVYKRQEYADGERPHGNAHKQGLEPQGMSGYERKLCDRGLCNFNPMVFRNLSWYYSQFLTVNRCV